ncbi:MAG: SGNH/GDSL hydrolase family protein [bacterium]|nr:SGNH/GDSL hydrolase family protein [bacterium]
MNQGANSVKKLLLRETFLLSLIFIFVLRFNNEILNKTNHITTVLFLGALGILPLLIIQDILQLINFSKKLQEKILNFLNNFLLLFVSILSILIALEALFMFRPGLFQKLVQPPKHPFYSFPENYGQKWAKIKGAYYAFYWHGKLHVVNKELFRRTSEDFPPKKEGVLRVVVLGDSHAYGYGIAAEDTYSQVMEKELKKKYSVEVLNLGVIGAQPHTYVEILQKYLPILHPDLVIYGVTQNDFIPPGKAPYWSDNAYALPLPEEFKKKVVEKTLVGQFFELKYNTLLFTLSLRNDYLSDVIRGKYNDYFGGTTKKMNDLVLADNLPPIVTFVTDQVPDLKGKTWKITQIAQDILKHNGFQVVDALDFYQKYNGQTFFVSPEEHHPNEEVNKIYAGYLDSYLKTLPLLQKYKI